MQESPILLYDIDGTLLKVHREFLFDLIEEQLQKFGLQIPENSTRSFAGRTDRGIFMELINHSPGSDDLFDRLKQAYSGVMLQHLTRNHMDLFDEALRSVHAAVEAGFAVGLCTGNFREVAMKKVETAGLQNIFKFGGFGEISADRNHLPGGAHEEYCSLYGYSPMPGRYVVIGDTPNDIHCAKHFGAKSVAVTTGGFSHDELRRHQPDLILDSLENPAGWLPTLGFDI
ncbi:MAG: HAD family hydrolase [Balneolaceae bacterium]